MALGNVSSARTGSEAGLFARKKRQESEAGRISRSQLNGRYASVEMLEMIGVLSKCDPGIELGWVSGTEFATGWSPRLDSQRRPNCRYVTTWPDEGRLSPSCLSEICIHISDR